MWRAVSTVPCTTRTSAPASSTRCARCSAWAGTVETAQGTPDALIRATQRVIRSGLTGSR